MSFKNKAKGAELRRSKPADNRKPRSRVEGRYSVTYSETELTRALQTRFDYSESRSTDLAKSLLALPADLLDDFKTYWSSGAVPDREVQGFSVKRLCAEQGMTVIAAILTQDWLRREPDEAKELLSIGHDYVGPVD